MIPYGLGYWPLQLGSQQWPMVGCPPAGIMQSPQTLAEGSGADFQTSPVMTPPPGSEWFVRWSWQWWWWFMVLAMSHHGPLTGTPWGGPGGFCYSCGIMELVWPVGAEPVLPVRVNLSPPNWRVECPWEPLHPERRLVAPSPIKAPTWSLPNGGACWGPAIGPFPPSAEGPSCRWWSSAAVQASSLNCQTMVLEVA